MISGSSFHLSTTFQRCSVSDAELNARPVGLEPTYPKSFSGPISFIERLRKDFRGRLNQEAISDVAQRKVRSWEATQKQSRGGVSATNV